MRSSKVRLEQIADPDNLREAFLRAAKGKGHRVNCGGSWGNFAINCRSAGRT